MCWGLFIYLEHSFYPSSFYFWLRNDLVANLFKKSITEFKTFPFTLFNRLHSGVNKHPWRSDFNWMEDLNLPKSQVRIHSFVLKTVQIISVSKSNRCFFPFYILSKNDMIIFTLLQLKLKWKKFLNLEKLDIKTKAKESQMDSNLEGFLIDLLCTVLINCC